MQYVPALDGVRAIAVLVVLAFHARVPGFNGGFLGVDLFFVLSGYLITRILAEEHRHRGSISIGSFYLRRLRRLYPALLLFVGTYLLVAETVFGNRVNHVRDAIVTTLYLSDYGRAFWRVPVVLQHTWSLAAEEHFYLVWPLLLVGILKLAPRLRIASLALLFVAATAWRWNVLGEGDWLQTYYRFDTRLSGLVLGAVCALWKPQFGGTAALAGWAIFAWCVHSAHWYGRDSLMEIALAAELSAALIILGAQHLKVFASGPLTWLGRMSYGIYLWHYPFVYWMRNEGLHWSITFLAAGGAAITCAALSYYTIERTFRSRRARRAGPPGSAAGA
ncbi:MULTISPECIES: acyltransferase [unclassified Rubrivivax]|uniref:acyltransferase family protein n=1 Tax=unclassified Rubrivivax TaxID=2649762 RepID=UPI001E4D62D7|nr:MULTISPECIES: acyltransferase [unclassified Rubrivivax]MCC9596818.1 acyltransferase [Rubrivivax sp. JA1055]MCC9648975.1 acyltransferase [Rubrivivax sp. JA1029]